MRVADQYPINVLDLLMFPATHRMRSSANTHANLVRLRQERLFILLRPMAIINLINAFGVAWFIVGHVGVARTAMWVLPIWLFSIWQILRSMRKYEAKPDTQPTGRALKKVSTAAFFIGAWWAAPVLLYADAPASVVNFLFLISVGMMAGVAALAVGVTQLASRFMLGGGAVLLIGQILNPHPGPLILTMLSLCFAVAFSALNHERLLLRDAENEVAFKEIGETRAAAFEAFPGAVAYYEADGSLIVSNRFHRENVVDHEGSGRQDGLVDLGGGKTLLRRTIKTENGRYLVVQTDVSDLMLAQAAAREALEAVEESEASLRRFARNITGSAGKDARQLSVLTAGMAVIARHPTELNRLLQIAEEAGVCAANIASAFDDLNLLVDQSDDEKTGVLRIENLSHCCMEALSALSASALQSVHRVRITGHDGVLAIGYARPVLVRTIVRIAELALQCSPGTVEIGAKANMAGEAMLQLRFEPLAGGEADQIRESEAPDARLAALEAALNNDLVLTDLIKDLRNTLVVSGDVLSLTYGRQFGRRAQALDRFSARIDSKRSVAV